MRSEAINTLSIKSSYLIGLQYFPIYNFFTNKMPEKQPKKADLVSVLKDFAAGGISGIISKTATAPIERVKLIIQTQDANPRIISGEVPRYTGIGNAFTRIASEQGIGAFWR